VAVGSSDNSVLECRLAYRMSRHVTSAAIQAELPGVLDDRTAIRVGLDFPRGQSSLELIDHVPAGSKALAAVCGRHSNNQIDIADLEFG